jgi:hypothetical protein
MLRASPSLSLFLKALLVAVALQPVLLAEPTLDSLKQTYETEVRKIRDAHDAKLEKLLNTYGRSLDKAIEILKREGDPDKVIEAITEKRRFDQGQSVPNSPDADMPQMLQDIQRNYNDILKQANMEKGKKFVALTLRYVEALDQLMKTLTMDGELDLALNVKQVKKRVEFVLADVESRLPRSDEKPEHERQAAASSESKGKLPAALTQGLVLYYDFGRWEGDLVCDRSGKGNNGKAHNALALDDAARGAVFQSDSRAYVEIQGGSSLDPEAVTVSAWVRPAAYEGAIVDKTDWEDKGARGYVLRLGRDTKANFAIGNGRWQRMSSLAGIPLERWTHLLASSDGSTIRLYVNATLQGSTGIAAAMISSRYPLRVGHGTYEKKAKRKFDGLIDEVMIWNRALSDAEIKQLYELTGGK